MTLSVQDVGPRNDGPTPEHQVADAPIPNDGPTPEHQITDAPTPNDGPTPEHQVVDAPIPNDGPTPEHQVADAPKQPEAHGLTVAYAIMRALHGDRIPDGALGPDNVPAAVLDLPIAIATENLVRHAKRCQNLNCPHVPQPLRAYRRMRPDAIRNAKEQVYKALWTHPNHELVVQVRKQILDNHRKLADEISTGRVLTGEKLAKTLNELGSNGPFVLAAVLWALEFKGPSAEMLFRILVPLAIGEDSQSSETEGEVTSDDLRRSSLKAKRESARDFARFKRAAEQATKDLQLKTQALEKTKGEFEGSQRKFIELEKKLEAVERQLKDTNAAYRTLEHDAGRAARVNDNLRRDLRQLQDAQRELEVGRSDLARQLAGDRREVENLKLRLEAVPRGSDAVMEFLRAEEARIETDRTISSGGTRKRADQEWLLYRKLEKAFLEFYPQYREPPPVRIKPKSSLRLLALGGSGEVGRSCYLLELGKHRILVDCGIKPSECEDLHPEIERLERVDALILTHAHTDHIGWVPALARRFPELDIYCSEGTAALIPVMLDDCHQHYMRKMYTRRERAKYIANATAVEEKYDAEDVSLVPNLLIKCSFNEEEQLPFGDVSLRFYRAGHILGAASVLIQDPSGRRIFFSGDFSSFPQLTVQAADWPDELGEVDLLVLESTYGNRVHTPLQDRRNELISFIRKTIEGQGSVILASFGLGRAQELLKLISSAQNSGELPSAPVYVDGMIKRINPIYDRLADLQLSRAKLYEVSGEGDRQDVAASAQERPSIIVTTSGMLTGGPVLHYARLLLPDRRHRIVLTGYQDEGAPSKALRGLIEGPRRVAFQGERGEIVEFEAAMPAKEVRFSSHADQPGLIDYAGRIQPKNIALVHGEAAAQQELRQRLLQLHSKSDIICGPSELTVL
jgi:Cft2 family RNA processing exonuclease